MQGTREIALILEDDVVVVPHFWRWLRAAHYAYGARRDLAGISLNRFHLNQQNAMLIPAEESGYREPILYPVRCFTTILQILVSLFSALDYFHAP